MKLRVVFDTNVVVSRMLLPGSTPARAVSLALKEGVILTSAAALEELADVLSRERLAPYVSVEDRKAVFGAYCRVAESVEIVRRVAACRDPRDDMLLEVAVNGEADFVVTGDRDLLVLDPFESVRIVTPAAFLEPARGG